MDFQTTSATSIRGPPAHIYLYTRPRLLENSMMLIFVTSWLLGVSELAMELKTVDPPFQFFFALCWIPGFILNLICMLITYGIHKYKGFNMEDVAKTVLLLRLMVTVAALMPFFLREDFIGYPGYQLTSTRALVCTVALVVDGVGVILATTMYRVARSIRRLEAIAHDVSKMTVATMEQCMDRAVGSDSARGPIPPAYDNLFDYTDF